MGLDAGTPPGLIDRIKQIAADEVRKFARSGFLRNASITDGGLTIRGGFLRLLFGNVALVHMGPVQPSLPDGSPQIGLIVRRADGTSALVMFDADVSDGQVNQALNWFDRAGNVVFADDTNSGQGLARPYLQIPFYRARNGDWPTITAASFETVYRGHAPKQQPRLIVRVWGVSTVAGGVGEIRLMVNGLQFGSTVTTTNSTVTLFTFGPLAFAGENMDLLTIEVQARLASGTGGVQVGMNWGQSMQS